MFHFPKKSDKKRKLDRKVLKRNDISLLILDERWNGLFGTLERSSEILVCEEKLKELLKEQARLIAESKDIALQKKKHMDNILQLTTEAYDHNNEHAWDEMGASEKEIKRINARHEDIEKKLADIPELIKDANLELLEYTVNQVYFNIRARQKRVKELEKIIEETRSKLKDYIDEKESLSQDNEDSYTYFHDLLGAEELEKLDKEYFGE